jgi:hypothetical protein
MDLLISNRSQLMRYVCQVLIAKVNLSFGCLHLAYVSILALCHFLAWHLSWVGSLLVRGWLVAKRELDFILNCTLRVILIRIQNFPWLSWKAPIYYCQDIRMISLVSGQVLIHGVNQLNLLRFRVLVLNSLHSVCWSRRLYDSLFRMFVYMCIAFHFELI